MHVWGVGPSATIFRHHNIYFAATLSKYPPPPHCVHHKYASSPGDAPDFPAAQLCYIPDR